MTSSIKDTVFRYYQPATLVAIFAFWSLLPADLASSGWTMLIAAICTKFIILGLEQVNERHAGWRLTWAEFLSDLFYFTMFYTVVRYAGKNWADPPQFALKEWLGIHTPWLETAPLIVQVALIMLLIEWGHYWLHRAMHNWHPLWLTHAPHHYVRQLNALKGAVGNPVELVLIGLSVVTFFDFSLTALFCAGHMLGTIAAFAHANVRFNPPRWYSAVFTTVEAHSLHHSVEYDETRCNYSCALILFDRLHGTYRAGEAVEVGQEGRRHMRIKETLLYPFMPVIDWLRSRVTPSSTPFP